MADKDYKAFIVEGEAREPQIIDNISKVFFAHNNFKIITLPAGENIYMLWKKLKEDDFETDIIEVLRESHDYIAEQLTGLSRDDFSEIYLFFDYDTHQTNMGKEDDEDAVGGLYDPLTTIRDNYKHKSDVKWNVQGYFSYKSHYSSHHESHLKSWKTNQYYRPQKIRNTHIFFDA